MSIIKVKVKEPVDIVKLQAELSKNNSSDDIQFCAEELVTNMVEHNEKGIVFANGQRVDVFIDKKTLTPDKAMQIRLGKMMAEDFVKTHDPAPVRIDKEPSVPGVGGFGLKMILLRGFKLSVTEDSRYLKIHALKSA